MTKFLNLFPLIYPSPCASPIYILTLMIYFHNIRRTCLFPENDRFSIIINVTPNFSPTFEQSVLRNLHQKREWILLSLLLSQHRGCCHRYSKFYQRKNITRAIFYFTLLGILIVSSVSLPLCLSASLSLCLSVSLSLCLTVSLSLFLSASRSVCLLVSRSLQSWT
jgi:hypothetical protein